MNSNKEIDSFEKLISLKPVGLNHFTGSSPEYPWGRVYGGQVVAQALHAAIQTVDTEYAVHSVHAYFIRTGTSDEDIEFEVDRIRDGRSFNTRRVVAAQSAGAILNLSASFQLLENGPDIQMENLPQNLPEPEELPSEDWSPIMERKVVPEGILSKGHGVWIRLQGDNDQSLKFPELGLVYTSDDVPYDAAARIHPEYAGVWDGEDASPFYGASLDHAVWFHRRSDPYDWQFHYHEGLVHMGNRGLATGAVYSRDGKYLATVTQEILQRVTR